MSLILVYFTPVSVPREPYFSYANKNHKPRNNAEALCCIRNKAAAALYGGAFFPAVLCK